MQYRKIVAPPPSAPTLLSDEGLELADGSTVFTGRICDPEHPWVLDHRLLGRTVVPGTALLELAAHAGTRTGTPVITDLTLQAPLVLARATPTRLQVSISEPDERGRREVSVYSRGPAQPGWVRHASGLLQPAPSDAAFGTAASEATADTPLSGVPSGAAGPGAGPNADAPGVTSSSATSVSTGGAVTVRPPEGAAPLPFEADADYTRLSRRGYAYGPLFRGLREAWRDGDTLFARVALPDDRVPGVFQGPHPALLDAALHPALFFGSGESGTAPLVPFTWSGVRFAEGTTPAELWVRLDPRGEDRYRLTAHDTDGRFAAGVDELVLRPLDAEALPSVPGEEPELYELRWEEVGAPSVEEDVPTGLPSLDLLDLDGPVPDVVYTELPARVVYADDATVPVAVREGLESMLATVRTWLDDERTAHARLALVTWRSVAALPDDRLSGLAAAPVWGLLRSAQREHPDRFVLVDSDGSEDSHRVLSAAVALGEPQLALREGRVLVPRLVSAEDGDEALPSAPAWRLDTRKPGSLQDLELLPAPEATAPLGAGEVRVAVRAAGVNFRDVVVGLGLVENETGMGIEGAGIVLETGSDVHDLAPGDRVAGMFDGAFGPMAVADRRKLVRVPESWSLERAAAIPIVYLTAYYALVDLAAVRPGESVLLHAAAGGVGMAAAQLAQHMHRRTLVPELRRLHQVLGPVTAQCDPDRHARAATRLVIATRSVASAPISANEAAKRTRSFSRNSPARPRNGKPASP